MTTQNDTNQKKSNPSNGKRRYVPRKKDGKPNGEMQKGKPNGEMQKGKPNNEMQKGKPNNRPQKNYREDRRREQDVMGYGNTGESTVDPTMLFGRNSLMEALKAKRTIDKILVQKGEQEGSIKKIIGDAKSKGILVQEVEKAKLDEITGQERHQGVVAYVAAKDYSDIEEMFAYAKSKDEQPFILILENIQDPHNLGAIIRSAHNAGAHGIIIPKRRAVGLTGTVSKASAGALEYMHIAKVNNIAQTIEQLKEKGLWIACADMDGEIIYQENLKGAIGIVIGSEGDGISKLVKSKCDFVVSIPMYGKVTSLNASVAASILAYEVVRQRHF